MLTTLSCIAVAVYFEARGESMLGQRAVAEVILNRVADPRWPETACEVIKQKNQFSFYSDGLSDKPKDAVVYVLAEFVARDAIKGNTLRTGALYYHATYVQPAWRHKLERLGRIEGHIFYGDKTLAPKTNLRPKGRPTNG
tara:strand:- start:89 stop:508 length:420 start_codon:yes stop_codon:yes gene_type:complete